MPYLLVFVPLHLRLPIYLFIQHLLNQCCILYNGSLRALIWNKYVTNVFKTTSSFHIKCLEWASSKFWFLRKDVKLYEKLWMHCSINLRDQTEAIWRDSNVVCKSGLIFNSCLAATSICTKLKLLFQNPKGDCAFKPCSNSFACH